MKLCKTCNTHKPVSEFGLLRGKPRHLCKTCKQTESKEWYVNNKERKKELSKSYKPIKTAKHLKKLYGITPEQYEQMRQLQENSCAICGTHQDTLPRALCVDHDHDTGKIRGLLCDTCNRGLGLLKDNQVILNRAIRYLKGTL